MGEFANKLRARAADAIERIYRRQTPPESDSMIELITLLLEDGAGGVATPAQTPVSTEEWITWNEAALYSAEELTKTLTTILDREKINLPPELEAMRRWAASLLTMALDELSMR